MNVPPSVSDRRPHEVIRRLELTISRRLDGILHGDYRGLVPGHGSDLGEARPYTPGDDVRRIDWNVTARTQLPHIRQTIADHELEAWLLVDQSASLRFGTAASTKRDLAVAAVATVGFLTARAGNRIGAVLLDGRRDRIVPARQGRTHLLAMLSAAIGGAASDGGGTTDLGAGLRRLDGAARRRGLVVVVSDFLATAGWERPLRAIATRHDVLAIEIVDPRELELPRVGVLQVVDPETGRFREVQTSRRRVRDAYHRAAMQQRSSIAAALRRAGADHLVLRTDHDWLVEIVQFVALRRERIEHRKRAAGAARP